MSDRPEPFSSSQSAASNLQAGRDITIESISQSIITNQAKPEFFEPKLEQFKPPNFISPKVTPNLIQLLVEQNLLLLGESPDIDDKAGLARHLAWRLSKKLQQQPTSAAQKIPIKEWCRSSDRPSFDVALQETETSTIFILPQILPLHIEQDLCQLQRTAFSNGHYIIASTNIPKSSWKLSDSESKFWPELSAEVSYSTDDLAQLLIKQLKEVNKPLPPGLLDENLETDLKIGDSTLREVAQRLKTPERIARFVELLSAQKESFSKEAIGKLIELAQNNKEVLRQWFHKILKPHEQLLALGLNFFDGLFDDQCMAGVGELVEHEWHRREPFLRALDYCDLDNLHNFFRLVEIQAEKTRKFESSLPEQRRMLFEVAWDSYRLRLQTALPVMVQLVEKSVSPKSYERTVYGIRVGQNLYSTDLRRKQLRSVIAEAVSDIGLIDNQEIQETLLQLAAHSNPGVQAVAAQAMERWREYGRDRELFDTLKILLNSERRNEKKGENPKDNILSTIALTIGYAAKYDTPQKLPESSGLSEELCHFLKQLSENPSPSVRRSLGLWTLRMVVPLHLVQLRDILRDMTRHTDLIPYISESLREAYLKNSEQVLTTLDLWYAECLQTLPQLPQFIEQETIPLRQTLLATVALTYVRIQCTKGISSVTDSEAFGHLHLIFTENTHPLVRKTVIDDLCIQTDRYFQRLEPQLRNLV
ncbi:MAG TPA: HEAT repeat domain-containing protein, partial [Stenomitos sp.]